MPGRRTRPLIPSRRRRGDEEEEDESVVEDLDDDSLTDGSGLSNDEEDADEVSQGSGDEVESPTTPKSRRAKSDHTGSKSAPLISTAAESDQIDDSKDQTSTETNHTRTKTRATEATHDEVDVGNAQQTIDTGNSSVPGISQDESRMQKSQREQNDSLKPRREDPAFIPNRGGFFLHDDRTSSTSTNPRAPGRGRGRGGYPYQPASAFTESTDKPWTHDLHDRHEYSTQHTAKSMPPHTVPTGTKEITTLSSSATTPNRSFSFSTILGNVTVHVLLPGMVDKKSVAGVVRRHHTLLPQHRPPLRRDKPVRISIPDQQARYIFPSQERSFIFIPRALRPNQQAYYRGRGRGSFHNSRRTSIFGGSAYTPSAPLSRRSSLGLVGMDGLRSPAEPSLSRTGMMGMETSRPIVRLPSAGYLQPEPQVLNGPGLVGQASGLPMGAMLSSIPPPPMQTGFPGAIPMHQPRPKKNVSVADIEAPSSFSGPPTQPQPFHQQMPAHVTSAASTSSAAPNVPTGMPHQTSLTHIPEGVVYATPFQPYTGVDGSSFYANPYSNISSFYPAVEGGMYYGLPVHGQALAPAFVPGMQSHGTAYTTSASSTADRATDAVPHESNGMVYYINQSPYAHSSAGAVSQYAVAPVPGMMGMGGMVNVPGPYYYSAMPEGMYYSTPSG